LAEGAPDLEEVWLEQPRTGRRRLPVQLERQREHALIFAAFARAIK
jgi:hypothetical protein